MAPADDSRLDEVTTDHYVHLPPYWRSRVERVCDALKNPNIRWYASSPKLEEVTCPQCIARIAQDVAETLSTPEK